MDTITVADQNANGLPVILAEKDGDRFVIPLTDFARFLEAYSRNNILSIERFVSILHRISEWCEAHPETIRAARLQHRSQPLTLWILGKSPEFDFALSDQISDLSTEIGNDFGILLDHQIVPFAEDLIAESDSVRIR